MLDIMQSLKHQRLDQKLDICAQIEDNFNFLWCILLDDTPMSYFDDIKGNSDAAPYPRQHDQSWNQAPGSKKEACL